MEDNDNYISSLREQLNKIKEERDKISEKTKKEEEERKEKEDLMNNIFIKFNNMDNLLNKNISKEESNKD